MSNLESKLEAFRRRAEEAARKIASGAAEKQEEKPKPEPAAEEPVVKAEPVSARIEAPMSEAAGAVSQLDRTSVLASPRPAPPQNYTPAPQVAPSSEDIPEVEDYLPWLKDDEGTGEAKLATAPAREEMEGKPVFRPSVIPSVPPAESSTPRVFTPQTNIPSRDAVVPFEGTGQPRPIEKKQEDETAAKADQDVEPAVSKPKTPVKPFRVTLKQPAAPMGTGVSQEIADNWAKLPRHIQFLLGTQPKEVAQNSYKQFKETREEMIQRLLDPMISLEEAARILNVCPTTVRRYTNRGVLPHFRTVGNQRRFRLSDVLAFLETQSGAKLESE